MVSVFILSFVTLLNFHSCCAATWNSELEDHPRYLKARPDRAIKGARNLHVRAVRRHHYITQLKFQSSNSLILYSLLLLLTTIPSGEFIVLLKKGYKPRRVKNLLGTDGRVETYLAALHGAVIQNPTRAALIRLVNDDGVLGVEEVSCSFLKDRHGPHPQEMMLPHVFP